MTETEHSAEQAFAAALAAFQAECPQPSKDQTADTGKYHYRYADLATVVAAVYPALGRHGLSFTSAPTLDESGNFILRYALRHKGGASVGGDYPLPDPAKVGAQVIGSAITYARRYALCATTGVAPTEDDDDGHVARDATAAVRQPPPRIDADPEEAQKNLIKRRILALGGRLGYDLDTLKADCREKLGIELGEAELDELGTYAALLEAQVAEIGAST